MSILNNKSPKQRFHLLCIGMALLAVLAWSFSIRKTVEAYRTCKIGQKALSEASTAPVQIQQLNAKLNQFNQSFQRIAYDRELLFETVNTFCRLNNLSLSNFNPEERSIQNDFEIISNKIEVQGEYNNIVRLAYELEHLKQMGHIASLEFNKIRNRRTKTDHLIGTLYLQNINPANITSND